MASLSWQAGWKQSGPSRWARARASPASPPALVFLVAIAASMAGLAYAMRTLPIGSAYAV